MPRYPVLDNLKSGGVRHVPGDTVELDEAEADRLQKLSVVGKALPDEAEASKSASSADASMTEAEAEAGESAPSADASMAEAETAPATDAAGQTAPSGSRKRK